MKRFEVSKNRFPKESSQEQVTRQCSQEQVPKQGSDKQVSSNVSKNIEQQNQNTAKFEDLF